MVADEAKGVMSPWLLTAPANQSKGEDEQKRCRMPKLPMKQAPTHGAKLSRRS